LTCPPQIDPRCVNAFQTEAYRKFLFSLSHQEDPSPLAGCRDSVAGSVCPTSITSPLRPPLLPTTLRRQYPHHGTSINPKPAHTSGVEVKGVDGGSPAPGRLTAVRSPGTGRGRNHPTAAATAPGSFRGSKRRPMFVPSLLLSFILHRTPRFSGGALFAPSAATVCWALRVLSVTLSLK